MSDLTCLAFVELVTRHLDGALERRCEEGFLRHLQTCDGCARYLDQVRCTIDMLTRRLAER